MRYSNLNSPQISFLLIDNFLLKDFMNYHFKQSKKLIFMIWMLISKIKDAKLKAIF